MLPRKPSTTELALQHPNIAIKFPHGIFDSSVCLTTPELGAVLYSRKKHRLQDWKVHYLLLGGCFTSVNSGVTFTQDVRNTLELVIDHSLH